MGRSDENTSESEDWGDDGWTVACPCGINFDDGEEMVECDACRVWVHTRCCRVPKGLTHYICERCRGEQHRKQIREEVEVAALLADLPSARSTPFDERSHFFSNSSTSLPDLEVPSCTERALSIQGGELDEDGLSFDIPLSQRVHTHGSPEGEEVALAGAPSFSKHLWRHQLMVPKVMDLQGPELSGELYSKVDLLDLHGGDSGERGVPKGPNQRRLGRGAQAKAERRKRLLEVVERYEERRRQSAKAREERAAISVEGLLFRDRQEGVSRSSVPAITSEGEPHFVSIPSANGNACASGSSRLSSPGGTTSWIGGHASRSPYAMKKAAVLEYMQTSQTRCSSCNSTEASTWEEVKGLEGPVCGSCAARHREQKFCPHCLHIYQGEEERVADPAVWLVCLGCSRLVHRECQAKRPLNGTGPAKRSTFLCAGCVRERKRARQVKDARQKLAGEEKAVDLGKVSSKSGAVLRLEEPVYASSCDLPGIGLEDECSRPGGNFSGTALTKAVLSDSLERPLLRLRVMSGSGEEVGVTGGSPSGVLLAKECYSASPKAKKAAAIALAARGEAEVVLAMNADERGRGQDTEEAVGVPTPSGPEPELQRRDSDPGSVSVKNGDCRGSGGEGAVDSGSKKVDRTVAEPLSFSGLKKASAVGAQNGSISGRPGSPSPSSSSNSSSSQAREFKGCGQDPVHVTEPAEVPTKMPPNPADKSTTSPRSQSHPFKSATKLHHPLSVPVRPKALTLPPNGKKLLDFPDTPGSVTSEHKPSKPNQGAVRAAHLTPSARLVSSRPSHPTGLRFQHPESRPPPRHAQPNGSDSHSAHVLVKKESAAAPSIPKGMAEMPPPPPPVAPKRPVVARSGSDAPPLNDEELALLLHQELNSSPRMPRVSRSKKLGANGLVSSKRSNPLVATPPKRSRSGEEAEGKAGSKGEGEDSEPGEVESAAVEEGGIHRENAVEKAVKAEPGLESDEVLGKLGATEARVHNLPDLIETLGLASDSSLDSLVDAVSKHWGTLRTSSGEPYPPLQHQTVLEALSSHEEWAHLAQQSFPVKRKRTSTPILSDSDVEDGRSSDAKEGRDTSWEERSMEGGGVVDGSRVAKRKRSRRAVADLSDTSDNDEVLLLKRGPPQDHSDLLRTSPAPAPSGADVPPPKPAAPTTNSPPMNGNGHHVSHVSRPHVNGLAHLPPGRSSSSGPLSHSSAGEEEAASHRQGPPRRKRSRIDARMEAGLRYSGTPEDE